MSKNVFIAASLAIIFLICVRASAQKVSEPQSANPEWSQPYKPFRIVGNLYYVGTYDLACYLIVTTKGNILINTGLAASASMIKENIETLGFKFSDIKILLTTQAHYDHVGAMAAIKKQTGANMMVDAFEAPVLLDGGSSDYALGKKGSTFQPVTPDYLLNDRDTISLGSMQLVMLHHPGHTKGSCSFLFDVTDEHKVYKVLIANMPTIVTDDKLSDVPLYPEIIKDYAYTFNAMKKLKFDIWLSSHASQGDLHAKHKQGDAYNPESFVDRNGFDEAIADLEAQYLKKLEEK